MNKIADNEFQNTQVNNNKKNHDAPNSIEDNSISISIKNLSLIIKLNKSKKSNQVKSKKFDLGKSKKLILPNIKANFKTDFLILEAKKAFIHLQKVFNKAMIFRHFDTEHYICFETDISRYAIDKVLSQMTLDQYFSCHMTHLNHFDYPKSEIG